MKKKYSGKCSTCSKKRRSSKRKPYGTIGTNPYHSCDVDSTYDVSKSSIRQKVKRQIKKEIP